MKAKSRNLSANFAIALVIALLITLLSPAPADATLCNDGWVSPSTGQGTCSWHGGIATGGYTYLPSKPATPVKYSSCSKLKAKYPAGIAKSSLSIIRAYLLKTPKVWAAMYNLNKSLDYNKNGLICESLWVPWTSGSTPSASPSATPSPKVTQTPLLPVTPSPTVSKPAPSPQYTYTPEIGTIKNPIVTGNAYSLRSISGIEIKVLGSESDASIEACKYFAMTGCASKLIDSSWTNIGFGPDSRETMIAISVSISNKSNSKWKITDVIDYVNPEYGSLVWIEQGLRVSDYPTYFEIQPQSTHTVKLFARTYKNTNYSAWSLLVADGGYTAYMKIN